MSDRQSCRYVTSIKEYHDVVEPTSDLLIMTAGKFSIDISSAGEVLVAMVERDMLCNLSRGGAGMHPTIIRTMLPFAVLQISQYSNMPLNRSTKQWSGR